MDDEKTTQEPTPQETPKQSPAEKRINELYGKYKQAQEQTAQYEAQNAELRTQLAALTEEVTSLKTARPLSPIQDPFAAPAVPQSSGALTKEDLDRAVQQAVGPFIAERKHEAQLAQLQTAQRNSYFAATREFPELADPNSELARTAGTILKLDTQLQLHPDGPYLATLAARGAMSSAAAPVPEAVKIAASQLPVGAPPAAGTKKRTRTEIEAEMDSLMDENRKKGWYGAADGTASDIASQKRWIQYRQLQAELAKRAAADADSQ